MRIVVMFLLFISQASFATENNLYRWQDANGQWHFGDAASSNGQQSQVIELPSTAQNVVKIPKVKLPKIKTTTTNVKINRTKQDKKESLAQKKLRCDKKRDELRFKAFRTEERNQYDHECISEVKW